jgi:YegS/Rv2252/BmrU family lipid kinase
MPPTVVIIINPISGPARRGRGPERVEMARRAMDRLGLVGHVHLTEHAGHAHELAHEAAQLGAELVVAWGGDGTINEVARALVQLDAEGGATAPALGIVPGGSGNGLARELRIPFKPELAIERAVRASARLMDVGEIGDHLFFNVAGIGLDAHVAALVSTRVHHRGLLPYLAASFGDLVHYAADDYTVEVENRKEEMKAVVIAIANSKQYGFGAIIAPAAQLDDGMLDLIAIEDRGFAGNIVRVPSLFTGRLDRRAGVRSAKVRELIIRSKSPMLFHVDGEAVQGGDMLSVRVHPAALRLRA